eukprot:6101533-Pyramimonas_sp.AAC.1
MPYEAAPGAAVGEPAFHCGVNSGAPTTRIVLHRKVHPRHRWARAHGAATPISAHLSFGSCPAGSSTNCPIGH